MRSNTVDLLTVLPKAETIEIWKYHITTVLFFSAKMHRITFDKVRKCSEITEFMMLI